MKVDLVGKVRIRDREDGIRLAWKLRFNGQLVGSVCTKFQVRDRHNICCHAKPNEEKKPTTLSLSFSHTLYG